jgi:micrococcal nuclease
MIGVVKILVGLLAVGGVGTGAVIALTPESSGDTAIVKHHVEGDTLDVDLDGRTERIRLLNIDTPETKNPNVAVQCLGPEAATYLATLIPVGTAVTLEYDRVRTDRYGRTLAGVFTTDHLLVNAEVTRQGFANTMVVDGNDRFYPPVEAARADAAAGGRGLYSPEIACTLPGQVQTVSTAVTELVTPDPGAASADLDTAAAKARASVTLATTLERLFAGERVGHAWAAIPTDEQQRLATRVAAARQAAQLAETAARSAAAVARDREAAEAAERDRRAREAEAQRAREAERQRAREAREEAAREAEARGKQEEADAAARQRKATVPKSQPAPANPYPGYTGPRCYAPGGKTWKPC